MESKAQKANNDIKALLKARNTLLWVTTREEFRVEQAIIMAAGQAKYPTFFWDCASGMQNMEYEIIDAGRQATDPTEVLKWIRDKGDRGVYVMRDLHKWFDPQTLRTLRNLARGFQGGSPDKAKTLLILSPSSDVPPELAGHVTMLEYPLPERDEIARILNNIVEATNAAIEKDNADPERQEKRKKESLVLSDEKRDAAIDAALGLTSEEAANCYAKSLVTAKEIDPAIVSTEKKRVVAREKVLTWIDPDPRGLEGIGGLAPLKAWLSKRKSAFSTSAKEFGLPAPKGVLLAGVPGCGKSLTAKCIASAWGVPLLRLDFGALRDKFVGESERKIRNAFQLAESVAPCVLWADEIEKSLGGSDGPQGDGGVSGDALGTFLTWMQDHTAPVFVVATANNVAGLPPELLRKGRFDELFWVDLPTKVERMAILKTNLKLVNREVSGLERLVKATEGFTGAEIAAIVPEALFEAFADEKRTLTADDLEKAAATVVPLSKTAAEKITALREWAKTRARPASTPETVTSTSGAGGRMIETDD